MLNRLQDTLNLAKIALRRNDTVASRQSMGYYRISYLWRFIRKFSEVSRDRIRRQLSNFIQRIKSLQNAIQIIKMQLKTVHYSYYYYY